MFLFSLGATAQSDEQYLVFETALLTPAPAQTVQFEKGLATHNKKYHGEGPYASRVYWISSGPNTGSYHWNMGPMPWSAMDSRPDAEEEHAADWNSNVLPYMIPGSGAQSYWKFNTEMSRMTKDFTLKNLLVDYYDIKRFKMSDAMKLVEKVAKVNLEKFPDESYGIYTNEFPSTQEGRDMAVISFFDKMAWLGEEAKFSEKYDDVHGQGSFEQFIKDWGAVTEGGESELWIFRPDLSGINGEVKGNTPK